MDDEINSLVFNLMCDLKKKEINQFARAKLLQQYIDDNKISARELGRQMGISHSVIVDWLRWNNIDKDEFDNFAKDGYTKTDVYRSLRSGTLAGKKALDAALETCISKLEVFKLGAPHSKYTKSLVGQLKHILKIIEKQVE